MPGPSFDLVPASQFTLDALTQIYNQARSDYLIPMQVTAPQLAAYMALYDVDLEHSWVAAAGDSRLGLGMLGLRPGGAWVTRLGVLPEHRRSGAGAALVGRLLEAARALGRGLAILEVIQGNEPARQLFLRLGFRDTRGLLILRRAAGPPPGEPAGSGEWLEGEAALDLLRGYPGRLPWTNEVESFRNGGPALGLRVDLGARGSGWLAFLRQEGLLSHFVLHTESGDPDDMARAALGQLFRRYPHDEAYIENVTEGDPHLPALLEAGFNEAFRRREMLLELTPRTP